MARIERRAVRAIAEALEAQFNAVKPKRPQDVDSTLQRLQESSPALRDAVFVALKPAVLMGMDVAEEQVNAVMFAPAKVGIGIDWALVNTRVLEWLWAYTFELVTGIMETSRLSLATAIDRWVQNGLPLRNLIDDLEPLFGRKRAELIGITEVTRAYAQANIQGWKETGVIKRMRWLTANDERVCPVCAPLGGLEYVEGEAQPGSIDQQRADAAVTDIDRPFVHPGGNGKAGDYAGQEFESPPAHPRCRCRVVAVVEVVEAGQGEVVEARQPAPFGLPVSDRLQIPGTKRFDPLRETVEAIDKVHGDGDLKTIPVTMSKMTSRHGHFKWAGFSNNQVPVEIKISSASPHPRMTMAHEVGHFLDSLMSRTGSKVNWSRFDEVVSNTEAVKTIGEWLKTPHRLKATAPDGRDYEYVVGPRYLHYILRRDEAWARAYSQYVATKSRNSAMLQELQSVRDSEYWVTQWSDEDFAPIESLIDDMFLELGWLQ